MSYDKTTWQTGDVVTAEKLNNIENGIEAAGGSSGGGGDTFTFTISYDDNTLVCDKTQAEIIAAIEARKVVLGYFYDDVTTSGEETTISLPIIFYTDSTMDGKLLMCQSIVNVATQMSASVTIFVMLDDGTITKFADNRYYETN